MEANHIRILFELGNIRLLLKQNAFFLILHRDWMKTVRPFNEIFRPKNFSKPVSANDCEQRLKENFPYYATNYILFSCAYFVFSMCVHVSLFCNLVTPKIPISEQTFLFLVASLAPLCCLSLAVLDLDGIIAQKMMLLKSDQSNWKEETSFQPCLPVSLHNKLEWSLPLTFLLFGSVSHCCCGSILCWSNFYVGCHTVVGFRFFMSESWFLFFSVLF